MSEPADDIETDTAIYTTAALACPPSGSPHPPACLAPRLRNGHRFAREASPEREQSGEASRHRLG